MKKEGNNNENIFENGFIFIHLSFQEYFGAKYISKNIKDFEIINFIKENKNKPKYELMLSYVSGLLKEDEELINEFMKTPAIGWGFLM